MAKFTDKYIQNLKATDKLQDIREGDGFGIRITPGGVKTFFYIYRFDGKRRFLNLGHYDPKFEITDANGAKVGSLAFHRNEFLKAAAKVKIGIDPIAIKELKEDERRKTPTVKELCEDYIKRYASKFKRSWEKDEQILTRDVIPVWGKRKAKDIARRDVNILMDGVIERGAPIMANYVYAVARKMFNWAIEQGILETTPFIGTKLPSLKEERKRVLNESEIKIFWDALNRADLKMSDNVRRCLKLILLTGQRPNEVAGIHSCEIDGHWWTIPVAKQKVSKKMEAKREPHRVFLTGMALDVIGSLEITDQKTGDTKQKGYIFPAPFRGVDQAMGDTALAVAVGRNLAYPLTDKKRKPLFNKDGKPATENLFGIDHFTPHDLRRTAATGMGGLHIMDEVIDAVLGHVKKGIIGTYNRHGYDKEKQQALEAWERKLNTIINGSESNVISINSVHKKAV